VRGLLISGALLPLLFASGTALAQACPTGTKGPPVVRVAVKIPETKYFFDKSREDLAKLSMKEPRVGSAGPNGLTLTGTFQLVLDKVTIQPYRRPDGIYCFSINEIQASWAIPRISVYIASKYSPSSCNYRVVMSHEEEHVWIYKTALRDYAGRVETELKRAALALSPFTGNDADDYKQARPKLLAAIEPVRTLAQAEAARKNAHIDTPESYRQVTLLCRDW
jgi:hypothetical protein